MSSFLIAAVVFVCVFGGALLGLFIRTLLPGHHLKDDSKDIVKLGIGVIATMTALVLGLLVSSAKNSFDKMSDELTRTAARVIELDRVLAHYGPDASEIRVRFRQNYERVADLLFSANATQLSKINAPDSHIRLESIDTALRALVPQTDTQRELRSKALALEAELVAMRWLLVLQEKETISMPLLVVVVAWLALIFTGFGLFSPGNGTVVGALMLCALSVSGAIFLILEMDRPLEGMVRISDAPMRAALSFLGQ
jgi:hypothetical protein